jgi:hypothetical protein
MSDIKIAIDVAAKQINIFNIKFNEYEEKVKMGIKNISRHFNKPESECFQLFWGEDIIVNSNASDKIEKENTKEKNTIPIENNSVIHEKENVKEKNTIQIENNSVFNLTVDEVHKMKVKDVSNILKSFGLKFKATKEEGGKKSLQQLLITHIQKNKPIEVQTDNSIGNHKEVFPQDEIIQENTNEVSQNIQENVEEVTQNNQENFEKVSQNIQENVEEVTQNNQENVEEVTQNNQENVEEVTQNNQENVEEVTHPNETQSDDSDETNTNDSDEESADVTMKLLDNGDEVAIDYNKCLIYKLDDEGDWEEIGKWDKENKTMIFHNN